MKQWRDQAEKFRKGKTCLTHCTLQVESENASSNASMYLFNTLAYKSNRLLSARLLLFALYYLNLHQMNKSLPHCFPLDHLELLGKLEKKERECETKTQEKDDMMKTLNKMKDKLQREGVELRSAREQVMDLSSRINDIAVSSAAVSTLSFYLIPYIIIVPFFFLPFNRAAMCRFRLPFPLLAAPWLHLRRR